jgi:alpha-L-arabinofuranosidase
MKSNYWKAILAVMLPCFCAHAQTTIFDQNFDGGYTGQFGLSSYGGGSPSFTSNGIAATGGNPNGCYNITMTTTTSGDYYAGQLQFSAVTGNTDPNPSDYVLSFDAKGSQAATIQALIQTWPNNNFGGSQAINATVNEQLLAANTWQTFHINLGAVTTSIASGATWQLSFQIGAWLWGNGGQVDTLTLDNVTLVHYANGLGIASSANPSAYQAPVTFTATVLTNGVTASNATGTVVFSAASGPFSTNAVASGIATSAAISNLPVGTDLITAVYSGGNYPAATNTFGQAVNPPAGGGIAQANLPIYTDNLVNGFQNWSWATVNFANFSPVHSGAYSIAVTDGGNQGLSFQRSDFSTAPYTSISFWANGGSSGGQHVQVYGTLDDNGQTAHALPALTANTWVQYTVPLSTLGMVNATNCSGFVIQGTSGGAQPTFYVDDVQLVAATPPAVVHLGVNAAQVLQPVDARQFGLNTATWDGILGNPQTLTSLQTMGTSALRWPGGSTSDEYTWTSDLSGNATFQHIATNLGAQVFTTVNYGSGTAALAAAWVLYANKTNNCGFKYWEVGNECYGTWENDTHAVQHDPYTYATNAVAYIQAMKAAYPTVPIKVGVVAVPGEGSFVNNMNHFAVNPRTGATNYGWTPVMLSQMKALGVLPDFIIYHFYWQYTTSGWTFYTASPDSDPLLMQVAENPAPSDWSDWASAAASLRQQITDYIGPAGTNIELCVTENNSDAGAMGRESTSLVNALYLADSTSQLMKTEFRSYIWWDLHNGAETDGNFDPTIYGWRTAGDYGVLDGSNNPYPTFYAEKLLQYFARPGDSVLSGTSDNPLLSAYAVRRTNGALTLLVVNKDMVTNLNAQIGLTNFAPATSATIQSYGIPQDQAVENNLSPSLQDIATTNFSGAGASFSYTFPPLSLTLFTFAPGSSTLAAAGIQSGHLTLVLQGQSGTPYITQSSPDLVTWTPVSTNMLTGSSTNINVPYSPSTPKQFYRAVWMP